MVDALERSQLPAVHRWVARPAVGAALNVVALLSLGAFGIAGIGRGTPDAPLRPDSQVLYVAGRMWLQLKSPYPLADFLHTSDPIGGLTHSFMESGFGYPPTASPLPMLLALCSLRGAFFLMLALNIAAVGLAAYYAFRLVVAGIAPGVARDSLRWFVPAVVIGNPFTTHIVYGGQTTMIATAALLAAWYYSSVESRPHVAGALFALSTMKPQVALFVIIWLVINARRELLLSFALTAMALVAVPTIAAGSPVTLIHEWLTELHRYAEIPSNALGFANVFGLQSLLAAAGVRVPGVPVLSLVSLLALWWRRRRWSPDAILAALSCVAPLFLYAHDYDLAALIPTYAYVWKRSLRSSRSVVGALVFYAGLFAPQRFVRSSSLAVVVHWRELILMAAFALLLADTLRAPPTPASAESR